MCRIVLTVLVVLSFMVEAGFGEEYKTVRDARVDAAKHLRARNFAAAQVSLEAALKLTPKRTSKIALSSTVF
jgi:hypothetical protein